MDDVVTHAQNQLGKMQHVFGPGSYEINHNAQQAIDNSENNAELPSRSRRSLRAKIQRGPTRYKVYGIMYFAQVGTEQVGAKEANHSN